MAALSDEERTKFESINPEIARTLNTDKTKNPESDDWQVKWHGYTFGVTELEERCRQLRSGDDLIEGIQPRRSLGLVVGDSGLGKSPLMYQMAMCIAAGIPFLEGGQPAGDAFFTSITRTVQGR